MSGKNAPELRFPEFGDDWESFQLKKWMTFKNGLNAPKECYGSGRKFINVLDIINNDYITNEKIIGSVTVSEEDYKKNIVEFGDILFQRSSETREEVGQANVYLDEEYPATFGGFVIRGKKIGEYDPVFMNKLLQTRSARKEITSRSGGSTRYNVGQETLGNVYIVVPSLSEQTRIATFLTAVDKRITLLQKKKEALELYKKGVMQKLFSGELRFKDDQGDDFPDWKEKKLGEVFRIVGGGTPESTKSEYWDGDIDWYTPTEIKNKYTNGSKRRISEIGLNKSSAKRLPIGTLLFTSRATIGEVAICKQECATNQGFQSFLPSKKNSIEFLYYWIKSNLKTFIRKSSGSTFLEISKKEISKIEIELPAYQEQLRIASFLTTLDQSIEKLTTQIETTQSWKKGLLQRMFV